MKRETVYFAHPKSMYYTLQEIVIAEALRLHNWRTINPSNPSYQRAYEHHRLEYPKEHLVEFWLKLASQADLCVFTPFPQLPGSVRKTPKEYKPEVDYDTVSVVDKMRALGKRIYWVNPEARIPENVTLFPFRNWKPFRCLSPDMTRIELLAQESARRS